MNVDSGNPKGGNECALRQGQAFEEERLCRLGTCASDGDAASPDRPVAGFGHPHIDGEAAPLEPGRCTESVDRIGVDLLEQHDVRNGTKGSQPFSLQNCRRPDPPDSGSGQLPLHSGSMRSGNDALTVRLG